MLKGPHGHQRLLANVPSRSKRREVGDAVAAARVENGPAGDDRQPRAPTRKRRADRTDNDKLSSRSSKSQLLEECQADDAHGGGGGGGGGGGDGADCGPGAVQAAAVAAGPDEIAEHEQLTPVPASSPENSTSPSVLTHSTADFAAMEVRDLVAPGNAAAAAHPAAVRAHHTLSVLSVKAVLDLLVAFSGALPRHQELRRLHPDAFVPLRTVRRWETVAYVSHRASGTFERAWLVQLAQVLRRRRDVRYVFCAFFCVPQPPPSNDNDDRSVEELAVAADAPWLQKWLCGRAVVVPMWEGRAYPDRPWALAELMWGGTRVEEPSPEQKDAFVWRRQLEEHIRMWLAHYILEGSTKAIAYVHSVFSSPPSGLRVAAEESAERSGLLDVALRPCAPLLRYAATGVAWHLSARNEEALRWLEDARYLADQHGLFSSLGAVLHAVGVVYAAQGRLNEALETLQRALKVKQAAARRDLTPAAIAGTLEKTAMVLQQLRRPQDALLALQEALRLRLSALPPAAVASSGAAGAASPAATMATPNELAELAALHAYLGGTHRQLTQFDSALLCYDEAVRCERAALGGKPHARLALTLSAAAAVLAELGRATESLARFEEARQEAVRALGEDHPDVAVVLHNKGAVLDALGRHDEAIAALSEALRIFRTKLGDQHGHTIAADHALRTVLTGPASGCRPPRGGSQQPPAAGSAVNALQTEQPPSPVVVPSKAPLAAGGRPLQAALESKRNARAAPVRVHPRVA